MLQAHPVAQVRAAEAVLLRAERPPNGPEPGSTSRLMMTAATGLAAHVIRQLRARGRVCGARVLVLAGSGDNGGDALHAGALLALRGAEVNAVLLGSTAHREGRAALVAAGGRIRDAGWPVPDVHVILDGVLGIGARGGLREPAATFIVELRGQLEGASRRPTVVAVDLPSGIGPDDGAVPGPVLPADLTVTFGTLKPGLLLPPAAALAGRVELVPIGLRLGPGKVRRVQTDDIAALWPTPEPDAHKYSRGVLGVVAGSGDYPGAAVLCTRAAVAAGLGMVRFQGSPLARELVVAARPEVVTGPGRVQAHVLGPGLAAGADLSEADAALQRLAAKAMRGEQWCVVDAGALTLVPELCGEPNSGGAADPGKRRWLLTPHAGELAALLGALGEACERDTVESDPGAAAVRAAELTGAVVLVKGAVTLVVTPGGLIYSQAEATPWLATAGAGDVLSGISGAVLAGCVARAQRRGCGLTAQEVARIGACAASVHGRAATIAARCGTGPDPAGGPIGASDVIDSLGRALPPLRVG